MFSQNPENGNKPLDKVTLLWYIVTRGENMEENLVTKKEAAGDHRHLLWGAVPLEADEAAAGRVVYPSLHLGRPRDGRSSPGQGAGAGLQRLVAEGVHESGQKLRG